MLDGDKFYEENTAGKGRESAEIGDEFANQNREVRKSRAQKVKK